MKVIELFSGIGGMKFALEVAGIKAEVIAVEINTVANAVYRHNFPDSKLLQKNLLSLNVSELSKFAPDMLLMSPPCQPFTRNGLKKDLDDVRTDPLKHILSMLADLPSLKFVLVENVKGFESSEARKKLVACLEEQQFNLRELLVCPTQIGVPNSRTRYYLLAKRNSPNFTFTTAGIADELPEEAYQILKQLDNVCPTIECVKDILETDDPVSNTFKEHLVPDKLVEERVWVMDIVTKESRRTCCFTKAYGHYVEGTGSVFCPQDQHTVNQVLAQCTRASTDKAPLRGLKLRYFTPREVASLMCFPEDRFSFPTETTRKQKYRLLGNSINVKVVALLIMLMCGLDR